MTPSLIAKALTTVLAAYAAIVFAAAEGGPTTLIVLPAAIVGLLAVDTGPKKALPHWVAAALGLVAVFFSVREFFSENIEGRLLSGGHLMAYLVAVQLLIRKSVGDLYRIVVLCGLLIALSSVLTNDFWLAPALGVFLIVIVWCLTTLLWERLAGTSQGLRRRQLAGSSRSAELRLITPAIAFGIAAFFAGFAIFLVLPRIWIGSFQIFNNEVAPGAAGQVGFADEVKLGDIGEILESDEPVLEITSVDADTGQPASLSEYFGAIGGSEPLFRGAVLSDYQDGQWQAGGLVFQSEQLSAPEEEAGLLRHEIYLHPIGTKRLFNIGPNYGLVRSDGQFGILINRFEMTLSRFQGTPLTEPMRYTIWSPKDAPHLSPVLNSRRARNNRQLEQRIYRMAVPPRALQDPLRAYLRDMPELEPIYESIRDGYRRAGLVDDVIESRLASEAIMRMVNETRADVLASDVASAIAAHFRRPEFTYTLNAAVDDSEVDPIIDFLRNRRTGHCEYYASANTLLLKAAGVPARLVSGFKGGVQDDGGKYRVSQLNAHAWCESYHDDPATRDGRWFTYDPTPATRAESVADNRLAAERRRRNPLNFLKSLWRNGVFMTRTQQQEQIYEPVMALSRDTLDSVRNFPDAVSAVFNSEGRRLNATQRASLFGVARLVLLVALLIGGVVLLRVLRRRSQTAKATGETTATPNRQTVPTPWYERFAELAAARLGRGREPARTHDEYALDVAQETPELKPVAEVATDEYYRIRFGRKLARAQVIENVESMLDEAEQESNPNR